MLICPFLDLHPRITFSNEIFAIKRETVKDKQYFLQHVIFKRTEHIFHIRTVPYFVFTVLDFY